MGSRLKTERRHRQHQEAKIGTIDVVTASNEDHVVPDRDALNVISVDNDDAGLGDDLDDSDLDGDDLDEGDLAVDKDNKDDGFKALAEHKEALRAETEALLTTAAEGHQDF